MAASVVCRQIGYGIHGTTLSRGEVEPGSGLTVMSEVSCSGEEDSLFECSHDSSPPDTCDHTNDAGVVCTCKPIFLLDSFVATNLLICKKIQLLRRQDEILQLLC